MTAQETSDSLHQKSSTALRKKITIVNRHGLHARPAALFVKEASQFQSEILVEKEGEEINGKSILGLMMLAASFGSTLTLTIRGEDQQEAMEALVQLIEGKFGES